MSAIEKYQPLDMIESIDDLARLSKSINASGFYKDITSADQVGVKLLIARELGLGINAISFIFPMKGKITLGYQILIALVQRSGKYKLRFVERTEKNCKIEWFEDGESVGFSSFSMDDAKRAGLAGQPNYTKNPIEMLVARAVSSGFNSYAPECAGGGLYTLGELDDVPEPEPAPRRKRERSAAPRVDSPPEEIVDAEVVVEAPEPASSAESGETDESASATTSISPPVDALGAVLKAMEWRQLKTVKARIKDLGIAWDKNTPATLVEHFAGNDDELVALLKADENGEVSSLGTEGEQAAGAARFQSDLDNGTLDDLREAMAAAGEFGS